MATFIRILLRRRAFVCAALALSLAAALYSARNIQLRFQYRDFWDFPANRSLPLFAHYNQSFGDPGGYVVAMIEADDVFRQDVLDYVRELTNAAELDPNFARVHSLSNANAIRGRGAELLAGPLVPNTPLGEPDRSELKRFVLDSPLLVRRLVSADATATALLADMRVPAAIATIGEQRSALAALERIVAAEPAPRGVHVRLTGAPAIEIGTTDALVNDQLVLVPVVCALLGLMLFVTFRSMHGVLLCMASVTVASVWTAGIFALFGRPVDLMGSAIPTTMLVYGVVDPIFVLARFLGKIEVGKPKQEAIVEALSELAFPCFLTSLTTSIGFAAFVTAASPSIRYLGLTVAIGVLLAFVTTVTVLPLLLSFAPLPKRGFSGARLARGLDRALYALGKLIERRAFGVSALAFLLLGLGGFFAREQHINNNYVGSLPNGATQNDVRLLEQKLSGVLSLAVLFEAPADAMKRPEVLRAIERAQRAVRQNPHVTFSASLADLVAEAEQAFQGGQREARKVPDSKTLVAQYLALLDPQDRAEFVSEDYARSQLVLLVRDRGSETTWTVVRALERALRDADFARLGVRAQVTGRGLVASRALDDSVIELLYGFVLAFLVVIGLEWLTFRSWRIALLTVIPNLIPIAACFATTRALNIDLRIDTILVLCVSIGGLFNTTIHFVARVRQQIAAGERDPDAIIVSALRTIGPPSLFTALVLSIGFAVFLLSGFLGLKLVGLLSAITMLTAFGSDVLFTPALIRLGFDWQTAFQAQPQTRAPAALPAS